MARRGRVEPTVIPSERYADRLARLAEVAGDRGLAAVLVGVGPDLEYLTGYRAMPLERLTMLVVQPGAAPRIVVPRLERAAAEAELRSPVAIRTWTETEDPYRLALDGIADGTLGVSDRLWASHLLRFQALRDPASFVPASQVLRVLRMVKDGDEIDLLRRAAQAADRVVTQIAAGRLVGRTEADVAREVRDRLLAEGHDEAHFAIVGSGPNSASPHHEASERIIQAGEPIVLDIGGTLDGYGSDITRTLWVTGGDPDLGPDDEFRRLFELVRDAQSEGTAAARPGVAAERVDAVARGIIDAGGYGEHFIHRLGHGIGLEGHEDPYLVAGNDEPLAVGHAFSVEPGIYLEGRYGARIEDIVVLGPDGPLSLNEAPRDLYVVDG